MASNLPFEYGSRWESVSGLISSGQPADMTEAARLLEERDRNLEDFLRKRPQAGTGMQFLDLLTVPGEPIPPSTTAVVGSWTVATAPSSTCTLQGYVEFEGVDIAFAPILRADSSIIDGSTGISLATAGQVTYRLPLTAVWVSTGSSIAVELEITNLSVTNGLLITQARIIVCGQV